MAGLVRWREGRHGERVQDRDGQEGEHRAGTRWTASGGRFDGAPVGGLRHGGCLQGCLDLRFSTAGDRGGYSGRFAHGLALM
jgi:hypothetical protein